MGATSFTISPRGPFSWALATTWLDSWAPVAHHPHDATGLTRITFPLDGSFQPVAVVLHDEGGSVHGEVFGTEDAYRARAQIARIFSLDVDAATYPEVGGRDADVGRLMASYPGLRPMLFTSPYECAAWGVLSQRVSMCDAAAVQARLVAEHGARLDAGGVEVRCFPSPERLLSVTSARGLPAEKLRRLHAVAEAALADVLDPGRLAEMGPSAAVDHVRAIPGIGPFWASAIYLRAVGATDVWPEEPRSLAALAQLKGIDVTVARTMLADLTDPWRPWRTWIAVLLRVAANRLGSPTLGGAA